MIYTNGFNASGFAPSIVHPQLIFHPQSGLNDAIAAAAPTAGHTFGTYLGHPAAGTAVGHVLAEAARQFPLPVATHTGPIGTVISTVAPHAGSAIGTAFGYPNAGTHVGNIVSEAARYLPFSAEPQVMLAPQGIFGSLIGAVAPTVGHLVGNLVGHPNAGQQIGTIAGHVGSLLPFSAEPQVALAPQGVFGNLISAVAPTVGHLVGNLVGHPNAGQQIGTIAGHVGGLLPFSAEPQVTLAPQGVFGNLVGALAPRVGSVIGGVLGHPNAGQQIGTIAGHLGSLLPFSAEPQMTLAPQGVFGNLVGAFAPKVGSVIGGVLGHPNAGQQIGTIAGHLGSLLPFSAAPQVVIYH